MVILKISFPENTRGAFRNNSNTYDGAFFRNFFLPQKKTHHSHLAESWGLWTGWCIFFLTRNLHVSLTLENLGLTWWHFFEEKQVKYPIIYCSASYMLVIRRLKRKNILRMCSVKKVFLNFRKINWKILVAESLFIKVTSR